MTMLICLTRGKFAIINDEDYHSLSQHKWYAAKDINTFYAKRRHGSGPNRKTICMQNEILGVTGADHKNGNGLDNRRENLRPANSSQQRMNSSSKKGKRFKGTVKSSGGNWISRIRLNKRNMYLGCFVSEEDAAIAYDKKARELFGEFARTNF